MKQDTDNGCDREGKQLEEQPKARVQTEVEKQAEGRKASEETNLEE
jgi:hypothetical protein